MRSIDVGSRSRLLTMLMLLVLLACAACSGGGAGAMVSDPQQTGAGLPEYSGLLPAPAELARSASYIDSDRIKAGWMYGDTLPQQRVTRSTPNVTFSPNYFPGPFAEFDNVAFATYAFSLQGFDGTTLLTDWQTAPAAGLGWIALANFKLNRWEWFADEGGAPLSIGSFEDFLAPGTGQLYAVVLVSGKVQAELRWLRVGDNVAPLAVLNGNPDTGDRPLSVILSTTGSNDIDGAIASYDWDLDGDGTFEELTTPDAEKNHIFDTAGTFDVQVRIVDNQGAGGIATKTIVVNEPGRLPPVAQLDASPLSGTPPLKVDFDASGSTADGGSIVRYEWDWEGDGSWDLDSGATPTASHTYDTLGTYQATVRVWDDIDVSDTEQVTVSVNSGNLPPTASFTADAYFGDAPLAVNFDASGSTDSDGSITLYEWDWQTDGTYDYNSATPLAAHSFSAGTHNVTLRVTDNNAASDTVSAQIRSDGAGYDEVEPNDAWDAGNALPKLDFSGFDASLGDGGYDDREDFYSFVVPAPGKVTLHMIHSHVQADLDMKLLRDDGDGTPAEIGSSTSVDDDEEIVYTFGEAGTYYWRCYVYSGDSDGLADYTLWAKWEDAGQPPVAEITATPQVGTAPVEVYFDASGSHDAEGGIAKYEWDLDGNGTYEASSTSSSNTTAYFYRSGSYNSTVRVTDEGGLTDTASITVTINPGGYDETENNDSTAEADSLPGFPFSGWLADLGHDGYDGDNEDWYAVTLAVAGTVDLTMLLHDPFGDLDMKLYESDGSTEVGSSTGTDNDENISEQLPAGTYYLKCYVYNPSSGNYGGYQLSGAFIPD